MKNRFCYVLLGLLALQVHADPVQIENAGFEDPVLPPWQFTSNLVPGWEVVTDGGLGAGVFNITPVLAGGAPEGRNTLYVNFGGATVTQTLTESLTANTLYRFSFDVVARSDFGPDISGYLVELVAGNVTLASVGAAEVNPPNGTSERALTEYFAGPDDVLLGEPIGIRFTTTTGQPNFDDVQLNAEPCLQSTDCDGDGVSNDTDNCLFVDNADQTDADSDGFGNICDADLNNDCIVNVADLGILRSVFFTADAAADFNGDGIVNVFDLGLLRSQFFLAPGPSGLSNCATD